MYGTSEPYFAAFSHQLIVLLLVNKFPTFYGTKLFITVFKRAPHCPYPETHIQSTSSSSYYYKIRTNIILPYIPKSSSGHFFPIYEPNFVFISLQSYTCYIPHPAHSPWSPWWYFASSTNLEAPHYAIFLNSTLTFTLVGLNTFISTFFF